METNEPKQGGAVVSSAAPCELKEQEPGHRCRTCRHVRSVKGRRGARFLCRFTGRWLNKGEMKS